MDNRKLNNYQINTFIKMNFKKINQELITSELGLSFGISTNFIIVSTKRNVKKCFVKIFNQLNHFILIVTVKTS